MNHLISRILFRAGAIVRPVMLVALSVLVVLVVANLGAALYLDREPPVSDAEVNRTRGETAIARYGLAYFRRLYPNRSDEQIRQILLDPPAMRPAYEPFAEYRNTARASASVNIHQAGFRLSGDHQGPWPLDDNDLNIFVFGGSTTLGLGVEDDKAIPAVLQEILRRRAKGDDRSINVYNFAVSSSFSSQEVAYFHNQLRYGNLPDMVVFVDGMTDFQHWDGDPANAKNSRIMLDLLQQLNRQLGREEGVGWHVVELLKSLPLVKLAARFDRDGVAGLTAGTDLPASRAAPSREPPAPDASARIVDRVGGPPRNIPAPDQAPADDGYASRYADDAEITDPDRIRSVIIRYLVNKSVAQATADAFGIEAIFAWQPAPLYHYDLAYHPFDVVAPHRRVHYGYPAMARHVAARDMGGNFAWCADIQRDIKRPLYMDQVHYSEEGHRLVAGCIAETIVASGALERLQQRNSGGIVTAALTRGPARPDIPVSAREPEATMRFVAPLFGPHALTAELDMARPPETWGEISSAGIRLGDASKAFAMIYETFPLEPAAADRTYQVSIRIKPDTSEYLGLVLMCVGGPRQESYVLFVNPQTTGVVSAKGLHEVKNERNGWTRLTLGGSCRHRGNDRLQVMLYPAHGADTNRGAVIFGGGEVVRVGAPAIGSKPGAGATGRRAGPQ
jgi:hypothetical protein